MVDRTGLEPVTSSMSRKRATNCANGPHHKRFAKIIFVPALRQQDCRPSNAASIEKNSES